jgi:di- and tripeptidase
VLEIDKQDIYQFAHFGYVYCMLLISGITLGYPREELLVSGGGDGAIKLWRLDPGKGGAIQELHKLEDGREEGDSVFSIAFDGSFLYSGRPNGEVNVWDLETKQLVRSLRAEVGDVLALSVGGGHLFSAGVDGIVEVCSLITYCSSLLSDHTRNSMTSTIAPHVSQHTKVWSYRPPS